MKREWDDFGLDDDEIDDGEDFGCCDCDAGFSRQEDLDDHMMNDCPYRDC